MKVYVVICYDQNSASGENRFQDVYIFSNYEKAQEYQKFLCDGKRPVYDYAEIEERIIK